MLPWSALLLWREEMPVWDQIRGLVQNRRNDMYEAHWATLSKCHPDGEMAVWEMVHGRGFFQEGWVRVWQ